MFPSESWAVQLMVVGSEPHGPLEVEEAIKAQIPRRHQGSDEDPTVFFCAKVISYLQRILLISRVNTRV